MNDAHIHATALVVLGLLVAAALPLWWAFGPTVAFDLAMAGARGCF